MAQRKNWSWPVELSVFFVGWIGLNYGLNAVGHALHIPLLVDPNLRFWHTCLTGVLFGAVMVVMGELVRRKR